MAEENPYSPSVGDWYKNSLGLSFEIVAVDEADDTIAVQYYDGEVEEYDMETWRLLELTPIAPPEDWSAPFDDLEKDDLGYADGARAEDRISPLDEIDRMD